ncbi:MAG: hypothetical protein PHT60_10315 [Acidiphilium sp.]|nr:hypothetical protein [Acidiphilium sp.]MDD4936153.1 hypothetical protein [Acidiphilium sp.]
MVPPDNGSRRRGGHLDDTVRVNRPVKKRGRFGVIVLTVAGVAVALVAAVLGWVAMRPAPFQLASEGQIFRHVSPHFTVFRFRDDPLVLVVDCPDLHAQGLMFDRVAALIEKADAPKDRVLSQAAFKAKLAAVDLTIGTYYYGDDYPAHALRQFFRLVRAEHLTLNLQERRLRAIAAQAGFLTPGANGAVISIPRAGPGHRVGWRARAVILRHELSHGAYFTNPVYRAFVHRFYNTVMTAAERAAFQDFLVRQGYDADYRGLIVNETLAYLIFTRDKDFFRAEAVGLPRATITALRAQFVATMPDFWLKPLATAPLPLKG